MKPDGKKTWFKNEIEELKIKSKKQFTLKSLNILEKRTTKRPTKKAPERRKTLNRKVRLSNVLKLDQQFIYFNAAEIFCAFDVSENESREKWNGNEERKQIYEITPRDLQIGSVLFSTGFQFYSASIRAWKKITDKVFSNQSEREKV